MKKESYSFLLKKHKEEASDFLAEQDAIVNFLNSPARKNWLKIVGLKKQEINKVSRVIDHYSKLKVTLENKKKPRNRKGIIAIEDACLRLVFQAKVVRMSNVKTRLEKLKALGQLLASEYKGSVLLNTYQAEKIAVLSGSKNMATDFVVFDANNNKIVAVELEKH